MHRCALTVAAAATLVLCARPTPAQTLHNFTNTAGGAWSVAGNWTSSGTPPPNSPSDIARFNLATSYNVDVDGSYDVLALQFGATQTGSVTLRGQGGTAPRQIVLNPGTGADGSIPANNGQTTVFVQAGSHTAQSTMGIFLGGGSPGSPVSHVWEVQGSSSLTVSGPISATSSAGNTLTKVGTGTLTLAGNNSQPQLWTGGLTVSGGTVNVNGPLNGTGTGPVTVNNGATLGGRGQINMGVSTQTTINSGGTLTAGTSAAAPQFRISTAGSGGLTMNAGSTYSVRLFGVNSTEISLVTVQGDAVVNTNKLALDLGGLSSGQADQMRSDVGIGNSRVYRVMTASESMSGAGFDAAGFSITNMGFFTPGEWSFGTFDTGGDAMVAGFVTVVFTPVPEVRSILALAVAALTGFRLFRRCRFWSANDRVLSGT